MLDDPFLRNVMGRALHDLLVYNIVVGVMGTECVLYVE
jgi:hypothetical protein